MIESPKVNWPEESLKCHYHKDQIIHNFCTCDTCLLPLCPKCIKTHTDDHCEQNTCSNIETVQETIQRTVGEITSTLTRLNSQLKITKQYNSQKYVKLLREQVNYAKKEALEQLQSFFQKLESALALDMNNRIEQFHFTQSGKLDEVIIKKIKTFESYLTSINKYSLSDLIKYLSSQQFCSSLTLTQTIKDKVQVFNKNDLSLKVHRIPLYDSLKQNIEIIYPIPVLSEKVTFMNTNINTRPYINEINNYVSHQPLKKCGSRILKPPTERCRNNGFERQRDRDREMQLFTVPINRFNRRRYSTHRLV